MNLYVPINLQQLTYLAFTFTILYFKANPNDIKDACF